MASEDTFGPRRERPLSPHLQIYRPIITMVLSIMHRVTGILNIGGLLLVVTFLLGVAMGPESYQDATAIYSSWFGRVVLVGFTFSLIHHMLGGIRHLMWDFGKAFGEVRYGLAWANIAGSVLATAALWALVVALENA